MRITALRTTLLSLVLVALVAAGCAKHAPVPLPAPPAPAPKVETPAPKVETPAPKVETPATVTATVTDLKTVYFALDAYALDDGARATLDANARMLRDNPKLAVRVEGNADERGTTEYNMQLGQKRAEAVRDYLVGAGVPAAQLSTISYGKERPAVDGHDESAWSKNRRADFGKP